MLQKEGTSFAAQQKYLCLKLKTHCEERQNKKQCEEVHYICIVDAEKV